MGDPLPGQVALGTIDRRLHGDDRYVPIENGQDAELAPGAQGGFHVWLHYKLSGMNGRLVVKRIADRVTLKDGGEKLDRVLTTEGVQVVPAGVQEWQTKEPLPNFMCPTPLGINIIDQLIEMKVVVEDMGGRTLGQARSRVRVRCPGTVENPDPQREFCLRICSG